jgi:enediyne biosynthesis protein E4
MRFEPALHSGIHFVQNNSLTPERHQVETMTGGVALLDYDGDGRLDIYLVNGAALPSMNKSDTRYWNRLYRNLGKLRFEDVTEKANAKGFGYDMGAAAGDYDGDGDVDLFLTGAGGNTLLRNDAGIFANATQGSGILPSQFSVSAAWLDYDRDGDLDLFVVQYIQWQLGKEPVCRTGAVRAYCHPNVFTGEPNRLYRNDGGGKFTDMSEASGLQQFPGKGMGVAVADYDRDGWLDLFIANDTLRNFLLRNKGDGSFEEMAILAGVAWNENGKSIAGMGADFRDLNNDGRPDIVVTGMLGDTFPVYLNQGADFRDITASSGMARASTPLTGWGVGIFDFDNDGWKDIFTANAAIQVDSQKLDGTPFELSNLVMRNVDGLRFQALAAGSKAAHRGAAFGDLDNDGRVDVVLNNLNAKPEILINRTVNTNRWLMLEGLRPGTSVTVECGGRKLHNMASTAGSYASSNDARVHIGLGACTTPDRVVLRTLQGAEQVILKPATNQILRVTQQ